MFSIFCISLGLPSESDSSLPSTPTKAHNISTKAGQSHARKEYKVPRKKGTGRGDHVTPSARLSSTKDDRRKKNELLNRIVEPEKPPAVQVVLGWMRIG